MARIRISRNADGTFRVRGTRKAGKQILGTKVVRDVPADDVGKIAGEILRALGNPGDRVKGTTGSAGERREA